MKQNLPPAKPAGLIGLIVTVLALCLSACATLPRQTSSDAQVNLEAPKVKSAVTVNINVASATELAQLPGVGKVTAERIIAHRRDFGPFRRAEHLMMVSGISERKFRAILPMIAVD